MDPYVENLLRLLIGNIQHLLFLQVSREMFGKSYTSLSNVERIAVDNLVFGMQANNARALTSEVVSQIFANATNPQAPEKNPVGFVGPQQEQK